MSFAIRSFFIALTLAWVSSAPLTAGELREKLLKKYALLNGFTPATSTHVDVDQRHVSAGELLFKSKRLSISEEISCETCHKDEFGSADGLPNAIGTGGKGAGVPRLRHGGDIIPRNTFALWGRGGKGFSTFFWDGKVDLIDGTIQSQFGEHPPSDDPLEVAVHLPLVEIREMVPDKRDYSTFKNESREAAEAIFRILEQRVSSDAQLANAIVEAYHIQTQDIRVSHIAGALAAFIRHRFRLLPTRFHNFVFENGSLSPKELRGGIIFYGKGLCSTCHNGPYFSDFKFHAVPTPQIGFGKNGFGIDYGRYNVSLDPKDIYRFRTPPLVNVERTAPFGHSGSLRTLEQAITAHIDPLLLIDSRKMTRLARTEYYNRLSLWSRSPIQGINLTDDEVTALAQFLKTLTYAKK